MPHHSAGRMDSRRRAKSQGCHGAATLSTTATRGWRRDGRTGGCREREEDEEEEVEESGSLEDVVGAEGVEEARWWTGGAMAACSPGIGRGEAGRLYGGRC